MSLILTSLRFVENHELDKYVVVFYHRNEEWIKDNLLTRNKILGAIGAFALYKFVTYISLRSSVYNRVHRKHAEVMNREWALQTHLMLTDKKELYDEILAMDFETLRKDLREGKLKAVDVVRAFQKKALHLNNSLNCVVHFLPNAEVWAMELDDLQPLERGPLHGIPFSVKECYKITGCDSTAGLSQNLFNPAHEDCAAVHLLKKLGAVPFCMTNVPQSMFSMQCSNIAFGQTVNPHNPAMEVGGSSGGEGALIGGGGSILGIANDVGGSLRNPAALCGIASLRPTHGRHLTQCGTRGPTNFESIGLPVVGGFMARKTNALVASWKATWSSRVAEDQSLVPLPWREERFSSNRKLRIGWYVRDGLLEVHPSCQRAVRKAVSLLSNHGHRTIRVMPPDIHACCDIYGGLTFGDGAANLKRALDADLMDWSSVALHGAYYYYLLPNFIMQYFIKPIMKLFTEFYLPVPMYQTTAVMAALAKRDEVLKEFMRRWDERNIDALIIPGALFPAPEKGWQGMTPAVVVPYVPWNVLNLPVGVVPLSKVTADDQERMDNLPKNELVYTQMRKVCKNSINMPVAVQVVGRRFDEEMILRVMTELENVLEEEGGEDSGPIGFSDDNDDEDSIDPPVKKGKKKESKDEKQLAEEDQGETVEPEEP